MHSRLVRPCILTANILLFHSLSHSQTIITIAFNPLSSHDIYELQWKEYPQVSDRSLRGSTRHTFGLTVTSAIYIEMGE